MRKKNNKKSGIVYLLKLRFRSGKTRIYTGRAKKGRLRERINEHKADIRNGNPKNTYVGRAESFKEIGWMPSTNMYKEEKTIKRKSPKDKIKYINAKKRGGK